MRLKEIKKELSDSKLINIDQSYTKVIILVDNRIEMMYIIIL
jgi:hypothetical protein